MTEVSKVKGTTVNQQQATTVVKKGEKKENSSVWSGLVEDTKELFGFSNKKDTLTLENFLKITNSEGIETDDKKQLATDIFLNSAVVKGDKVSFPTCTLAGSDDVPTMSLADANAYANMLGLKYDQSAKKFVPMSLLSKTVAVVKDSVDTVETVTGLKEIKNSLDKKDQTVELMHKDSTDTGIPTGYGVVSLVGQTAAQPTDVLSSAAERVSLDKTTSAVDASTQHVEGEYTKNAAKDLLRSVTAPLKIHNGAWNAIGGISDFTSACLKLEKITNAKIDDKTKAALAELATRATDVSLDNTNDLLTAYAVTVRLQKTPDEIKAMSAEDIKKAFENEQTKLREIHVLDRASIVRGAADKAADELMTIYSAYISNQSEQSISKLDKAQIALREGTSEALNLPTAAVDVASSAIKGSTKGIAVLENVGGTVSGALDTVTGTVQSVTTLWDGKEGSTTNALKKAGNGVLRFATFGFFGKDEPETTVTQAKPMEAKSEEQIQADKKAEYSGAYDKSLDTTYKENLPQSAVAATVAERASRHYETKLDELIKAGDTAAVEKYKKNKDAEIAAISEKIHKANSDALQKEIAYLKENSDNLKREIRTTADTIVSNAGGEQYAFTSDTARIGTRATNAASWGSEFWNQTDITYSNAKNPEKNGKLGAGEIGYRFLKGAVMEPLRFALTKGVTLADEVALSAICHPVGSVAAGLNAADRANDGLKTYRENPYNTAASQKATERGGAAAAWTAASITWPMFMKGNLLCCHHSPSGSNPKPDCPILDPENLVVPD